jgi:hypothetical protein
MISQNTFPDPATHLLSSHHRCDFFRWNHHEAAAKKRRLGQNAPLISQFTTIP